MGVMIIAGVLVVGVTIAHRMGGHAAAAFAVLDEPAGTRMVSVAPGGNGVAVLLTGGGPDRVVLLGPDGVVTGRVSLRR
jgi:hypothetical protein